MKNIKFPPDVEFHEDIRLFAYKPSGLLDEASINKVLKVLEELEAKLKEPFNRFCDTSAIDKVELNYQYVIQVSLPSPNVRRSPASELRGSGNRLHHRPLFPVACDNHSGLAY